MLWTGGSIILFLAWAAAAGAVEESGDVSCFHCHSRQVAEFTGSVHFDKNILCTGCHGGDVHISGTAVSTGSMNANFTGVPARTAITGLCSRCHEKAAATYRESDHWHELERGVAIAATCTDCHGTHNIVPSTDRNSSANPENVPLLCAGCHENKTKMSAWYYGIETDRFDTYKRSYHYRALLSGGKGLATCPDCHENHDTRNESDPHSAIYRANLPATCGKPGCHPGNSAEVYGGKVHEGQSVGFFFIDAKKLVTYFYMTMIVFELVFTLGLISLDISSKFKIKRRD